MKYDLTTEEGTKSWIKDSLLELSKSGRVVLSLDKVEEIVEGVYRDHKRGDVEVPPEAKEHIENCMRDYIKKRLGK